MSVSPKEGCIIHRFCSAPIAFPEKQLGRLVYTCIRRPVHTLADRGVGIQESYKAINSSTVCMYMHERACGEPHF